MRFYGDNIKKFRSEIDISKRELAEKFKEYNQSVTDRTITNWEEGVTDPDGTAIATLAQIFDKSVTFFFAPVVYQHKGVDNILQS